MSHCRSELGPRLPYGQRGYSSGSWVLSYGEEGWVVLMRVAPRQWEIGFRRRGDASGSAHRIIHKRQPGGDRDVEEMITLSQRVPAPFAKLARAQFPTLREAEAVARQAALQAAS